MKDVQTSLFAEYPAPAETPETIPFDSAVYADKVARNFVPRTSDARKLSPAAIDQGHGFNRSLDESGSESTGQYVVLPNQEDPAPGASDSTYHTPREMIDDTRALLRAISNNIPK